MLVKFTYGLREIVMPIPLSETLIPKKGYPLIKTLKDAPLERPVTINVPVLLREQVRLASAHLNMSMSKYIERAVKATLEGHDGF